MMKKLLVLLMMLFLFLFLSSSLMATEKFSLQKNQQTLSKWSLGKLVQTCKGLVVQAYELPQRLNLIIPGEKQCHLIPYDDGGYHKWMCVEGGGATRCPCEEEYIPQ